MNVRQWSSISESDRAILRRRAADRRVLGELERMTGESAAQIKHRAANGPIKGIHKLRAYWLAHQHWPPDDCVVRL